MARSAGIVLALAYAGVLTGVAFSPLPVELLLGMHVPSEHLQLWEAIANVALFVPFGWSGTWLTRRVGWVITAGIVVSVCIEVAQLVLSPVRTAAVADVMKNGLGTAIGCGLAVALRPHPDSAQTSDSGGLIS